MISLGIFQLQNTDMSILFVIFQNKFIPSGDLAYLEWLLQSNWNQAFMGLCVTVGRCGKEQNRVTQWQTSLGFRFFLYVVPNQTVSSGGWGLPALLTESKSIML